MSVTEFKLEKDLLVRLLKNKLSWSESILNSITHDSLVNIYDHIINHQKLHKAKVSAMGRFGISLHVPIEIRINDLIMTNNFNIKFSINKKEVYLDFDKNGKYHIKSDGKINLPFSLVEKGVLKQADDAMMYYKDGRITVKSFTYMQ